MILRAGTDQDLQVLNPFNSVVVADFEVYTLNYDLLVGFGQDLERLHPGVVAGLHRVGSRMGSPLELPFGGIPTHPAAAGCSSYRLSLRYRVEGSMPASLRS